MRMVFIHSLVYQDPLGIMYLAAALRRAGHVVHFVDVALESEWERRVHRIRPDVIGYSIVTGSQGRFLEINRRLKRDLTFLSLWGGPHPTFFPELIDEEGVDALCIGEGERAIVELAAAIDGGGDITSIPNLVVKTTGGVARNELRPLCVDLDSLAPPDRSVISRYPQYRYVSSRAVITSRGCPYSCTFCFNSRLRKLYKGKGKYTRRRSLDGIIEECARHREDPWARQIIFKDDLFAHSEEFVHGLSRRFPREVGLPFTCNVRADRMTERMAKDLARAGAKVVQFGVESGNDRIRREVLRRNITRRELGNAARWCHDQGIKVYTYNIVGIPDETPSEALETLEVNAEIGADVAIFTLFQPYPKTPLGDRAAELGWTDGGHDSFSHTYYENSMTHLPEARQFRNMIHLFPAAVRSRALRRLAPTLMRLPLTPAYTAFDFTYKATRFIFDIGLVEPRDIAVYSGRWTPKAP